MRKKNNMDKSETHTNSNNEPQKNTVENVELSEEWVRKVSLCEEGRAHENDLLHHYLFGLFATGAALLAGAFGIYSIDALENWLAAILGGLNIVAMLLWLAAFVKRGCLVDDWEDQLARLYQQVGIKEIENHYVDGRKRKEYRHKVDKKMDKIKSLVDNKIKVRLICLVFKFIVSGTCSPIYVLLDLKDLHAARWVLYLMFIIILVVSVFIIVWAW